LKEIDAINNITDKGMEVLSCIVMINRATKMLVTSPDKKEMCLKVISDQAGEIELYFEEYKTCVIRAVKEITSETDDSINGVQDTNGIRL